MAERARPIGEFRHDVVCVGVAVVAAACVDVDGTGFGVFEGNTSESPVLRSLACFATLAAALAFASGACHPSAPVVCDADAGCLDVPVDAGVPPPPVPTAIDK